MYVAYKICKFALFSFNNGQISSPDEGHHGWWRYGRRTGLIIDGNSCGINVLPDRGTLPPVA